MALGALGVAAYLSSSPAPPARTVGRPIIPPDAGPIDAPPEPPDFALDATRDEAAVALGAVDSFVLQHDARTLWAFVYPEGDAFRLRAYEVDEGAWRLRIEAAELSVRPHPDADPSRAVTGMRMGGMEVPFFLIVDDHDVRLEPGEGFFLGPPRTIRP